MYIFCCVVLVWGNNYCVVSVWGLRKWGKNTWMAFALASLAASASAAIARWEFSIKFCSLRIYFRSNVARRDYIFNNIFNQMLPSRGLSISRRDHNFHQLIGKLRHLEASSHGLSVQIFLPAAGQIFECSNMCSCKYFKYFYLQLDWQSGILDLQPFHLLIMIIMSMITIIMIIMLMTRKRSMSDLDSPRFGRLVKQKLNRTRDAVTVTATSFSSSSLSVSLSSSSSSLSSSWSPW